jgi:hypothetical protein
MGLKLKTCKVCKEKFTPLKPLQMVCGPLCAYTYAKTNRAKAERKELREIKTKLKTKSDWLREAQTVFNQFIRLRDKHDPCISCGRHHTGQYHGGHYRTVKAAPELRFNEYNCHKQCSACNTHLSGNLIEYRKRLINKIGLEIVEWVEGKHEPKHYTIDDIKQIKQTYRDKIKGLKNAANNH